MVSTSTDLAISRREQNKRDKLNRIVSAARALFQTQGFESTTTQQIAKAASIATGTLFLYAKSKEDLLVLVFNQEMSAVIESTFDAIDPEAPALSAILKLFQGFIDYHAEDVEIARQLIRELTFLTNPQRIAEVNGIVDQIRTRLETILQRARDRGELADVDIPLLARTLFAVYYQQLQAWLGGFLT